MIGEKPDVILVHFVSHFLSPESILSLHQSTGAPVIWILLDMGLLTGGCHYAWDCNGYKRSCGDCPALRFNGKNDLSARTLNSKNISFGHIPGLVAAGSSWLKHQAMASSVYFGRRVETILIGVSPAKFSPGKQLSLRKEMGVDESERIIFFGAQKLNQKRKGMRLLMAALIHLREIWPDDNPLPVLVCAGESIDF